MDEKEWRNEYDEYQKNPPKEGDFLTTHDGSLIRIQIDCVMGKEPFLFAKAYLPQELGSIIDWFARSVNDPTFHGIRCILLPKAKQAVIQKFGLSSSMVGVKELKVLRPSASGGSLLVEVSKFE